MKLNIIKHLILNWSSIIPLKSHHKTGAKLGIIDKRCPRMKILHHAVMHGLIRFELTIKCPYLHIDSRKIKGSRQIQISDSERYILYFLLTRWCALRSSDISYLVSQNGSLDFDAKNKKCIHAIALLTPCHTLPQGIFQKYRDMVWGKICLPEQNKKKSLIITSLYR